jgi:hypothetical protein
MRRIAFDLVIRDADVVPRDSDRAGAFPGEVLRPHVEAMRR